MRVPRAVILASALCLVTATMPPGSVNAAQQPHVRRARLAVPTRGAAPAGRTLSQMIGHSPARLRDGTPRQAGLIPRYADDVRRDAAAGLAPGTGTDGHPLYPGEVVLAARHGVIAERAAGGYNLRYANQQGKELPRSQWIRTKENTIFDLASLSKLFTSIAAMRQVERGRLDLNRTVASYIPAFGAHGKSKITIRQLMTHTSGLPPDPKPALWHYPTYEQRVAAIYSTKPQAAPGTKYIYSDLNMLTLGKLVEHVTGKPLDRVVHDGITRPLHMTDTMYNPPASLEKRIAAEEYQTTPDRGLVWGQVHDENAWAMRGVAGHAGVFSTARDLAILCQTILNGGRYGHTRILSKSSVVAMLTNENQAFPGDDHGLGFELYQHWYMGAMATPFTAGHTGYTGTSLVIDPTSNSFAILLTNRVHPSRDWGSTNGPRRDVGDDMSRAEAVRPPRGHRYAWYGGMADKSTATLGVPLTLPAGGGARLDFNLWYDTEPGSDFAYLEASSDGGKTWSKVPFRLRGRGVSTTTDGAVSGYDGRQWLRASAELSKLSGPVLLRWRYATDPLYHGRGVYVAGVRATAGHRVLFDDRRPADAAKFRPDGWTRSRD